CLPSSRSLHHPQAENIVLWLTLPQQTVLAPGLPCPADPRANSPKLQRGTEWPPFIRHDPGGWLGQWPKWAYRPFLPRSARQALNRTYREQICESVTILCRRRSPQSQLLRLPIPLLLAAVFRDRG